MPNPQSGTILGAYRVEGTIGSGSMGEVFRGIDTGLNRRVAIKLLSEKHRDSPELRQRFVREGRAVAAISHPNVVQVFATGSYDDRPYIAMELLDGADLGSIVERSGRLDSLAAAHAVLDGAQGLAAAARAGLIHRDVKPSNLVRLADGRVKVTDFGLAKPVDPGSEPALTAMGVVVGTPDYIAPEQARGEAIDERVDIYALGGTLYFLLAGAPPFRTGKPAEDKYLKVVARHLRNPPPDVLVTNPACDRELAELARTMMAKKPAERPGYQELIGQLTRIVTRLDPSAVPLLVATRDRSQPIALPTVDRRSPIAGGGDPDGAAGGAGGKVPRGIDRRSPIAGGGDPDGAAGGAGGKAPRGIDRRSPIAGGGDPDGAAGGAGGKAPRGIDRRSPIAGGGDPDGWGAAGGKAARGTDRAASEPAVELVPPGATGAELAVPRAGLPGWLVALTFVCIALFVAGLVVYLRRTGAGPSSAVEAPAADDMVLVRKRDGTPWFRVDPRPVTDAAFRQVFGEHKDPAGPGGAVVMVSYNDARAFAKTRGGRLMTSDEWDSAIRTPGVQTGALLEWIESPEENTKQVRQTDKAVARPDRPQPDVTFRMAKPPSGG